MSSRTKKHSKVRVPHMAADGEHFRGRKEEVFQLHDEADLVNFRADALNRYITNQDLLDNVASKLLHTSRIVPPSPFPVQKKKLYEDDATEEELVEIVRNLKTDEFFLGDLRLMKAKLKLSAQELEELAEPDSDPLSEETRFQKTAVEKLAAAQANCTDIETLEALEKTLESTLAECKSRFSHQYVSRERTAKKHAVSIRDLAPEVEVKEAPRDYNPRSIMSFINMKGKSGAGNSASAGLDLDARDPRGVQMGVDSNIPMEDSRYANAAYMSSEYDEFGIMPNRGPGNGHEMPYYPQLAAGPEMQNDTRYLKNNENPVMGPEEEGGAGPGAMGHMGDDVNMDDIDQFLADPDAGDGMDGMDALMDFGQGNDGAMGFGQNDPEGANMDDDPFSVDFLSQMGNDLE